MTGHANSTDEGALRVGRHLAMTDQFKTRVTEPIDAIRRSRAPPPPPHGLQDDITTTVKHADKNRDWQVPVRKELTW